MMNITNRQNSIENLKLLAAQRQLYSDAKSLDFLRFVLAVLLVPGLSIIAGKCFLTTLVSTLVIIINSAILLPLILSLKKNAALIQSLFESTVLGIKWNSIKFGNKPDIELIIKYANKYISKKANFDSLKDWYNISFPETSETVFACLQINVWWDKYLRCRYFYFWLLIDVIVLLVLLIVCCFNGCTLQDFLLEVVIPCIPVFLLSLRFYWQHLDAIKKQKHIYSHICNKREKFRNNKYADEVDGQDAILIQNEIYDYRITLPLIPDLFYNLFKKGQERIVKSIL